MPISYELTLKCCFCGKPIADETPQSVRVEAEGGGEQRFFAHASCLRDRLDPSVPLGRAGSFGIEVQHHVPRWTLRRVVVLGLIFVLIFLIPVVGMMLIWR